MPDKADIGLIGLAVMGQNLVLNMADHGYTVAVHNRTGSVTDAFLRGSAAGASVVGAGSVEELVGLLARPRRVMLMVQAGKAVDAVLGALVPLLDEGDIVIDGGNSHYDDTARRERELAEHGVHFLGTGVSGGEEGARTGPSIMPGGPHVAWEAVKDVLQAISAKVDGEPCCEWMGEDGAGHFVKMVHNGIEYGDMQLIAEAYHLMDVCLGLDAKAMHDTFARWNEGVLDSYLIEITRDILGTYDDEGNLVLDSILDRAGQKGTGRWTVVGALEQGQPVTLMTEAVFARSLSALKDERERAARVLPGPSQRPQLDAQSVLADLEAALYASKIVSYAQGYMLLRSMAAERGWSTDPGVTARIWRGGCIIRSRFLKDITAAYEAEPELENLMQVPFFAAALAAADGAWRRVVAAAIAAGIPTPAMSSALAFYDGYRSARLPANLIQAQRDYFGAHTYERVDKPRGEHFHTDWIGSGGGVTSRTYEA
ncbi:MAG: decarboxylating NADP(+)-dependent phosphogluconate dehydrogenase [Trueperaceae bacterium]|nr:decarboxylating NADP(+)-dependent phosphogluconate dehydrogenase [Trueperaceae bacterium]